jgi:hypothetical protein
MPGNTGAPIHDALAVEVALSVSVVVEVRLAIGAFLPATVVIEVGTP